MLHAKNCGCWKPEIAAACSRVAVQPEILWVIRARN